MPGAPAEVANQATGTAERTATTNSDVQGNVTETTSVRIPLQVGHALQHLRRRGRDAA